MSKNSGKVPNITDGLKKAVELYLLAKTMESHTAEKIDQYEREILASGNFHYAAEWAEKRAHRGLVYVGPISDPNDSYMMDDDHFQVYMADCYKAAKAAGVDIDYIGHCPLSSFTQNRIECERMIVEESEYITGIKYEKIHYQWENYKKYIDLTIKFVLSACPKITGPEVLAKYIG